MTVYNKAESKDVEVGVVDGNVESDNRDLSLTLTKCFICLNLTIFYLP